MIGPSHQRRALTVAAVQYAGTDESMEQLRELVKGRPVHLNLMTHGHPGNGVRRMVAVSNAPRVSNAQKQEPKLVGSGVTLQVGDWLVYTPLPAEGFHRMEPAEFAALFEELEDEPTYEPPRMGRDLPADDPRVVEYERHRASIDDLNAPHRFIESPIAANPDRCVCGRDLIDEMHPGKTVTVDAS